MKAVIVAAGFGTRFLPITKTIPKEMLPLGDRPILEHIVRELTDAGIDKICIVISRYKELVREYFSKNEVIEKFLVDNGKENLLDKVTYQQKLAQIDFVYQETVSGYQDAINCAKDWVGDDDFILCTGDDLFVNPNGPSCVKQMIEENARTGKHLLVTKYFENEEDLKKYGVVKFSDETTGKIYEIVEKPQSNFPSHVASIGRYLLPAKIFKHMANNTQKIGTELNFSVALSMLAQNEGLYIFNVDARRFDTGNLKGYIETFDYFTKNNL